VTVSLLASSQWLALLAADAASSKTADFGPGLTAFLIVTALGVATFLLVRSMLAHLKKVPPTFDKQPGEDPGSGDPDPADPTTDQ